MNGKKCKKIYHGFMLAEDNEKLKQAIIDSLKQNGKTLDDFVEDEDTYSVKGFSNFWFKSKLQQNEEGVLHIKSTTYEFNGVRGNIPVKDNFAPLPDGNGFTNKINDKQSITFVLCD